MAWHSFFLWSWLADYKSKNRDLSGVVTEKTTTRLIIRVRITVLQTKRQLEPLVVLDFTKTVIVQVERWPCAILLSLLA